MRPANGFTVRFHMHPHTPHPPHPVPTGRSDPSGHRRSLGSEESLAHTALDGLVESSGGRIARLGSSARIKVVVRTDWDRSRVAILSGGGSGHEPAHVGFVGPGMLTAAIAGDIFVSPTADAVLAGILAVTGRAGCLLIVKNFTGDRLHFGLAAERARAYGLKVSMVIVADDVAIPDVRHARGLAGTLFVHKVAGALAEDGASLEEVTAAAMSIARQVVSLGMSLNEARLLPHAEPGLPSAPLQVDIGLGIHGEPGAERVPWQGARTAMQLVCERLSERVAAGPLVALLNNLGNTTPLEMSLLAQALGTSTLGPRIQALVGPASLMTSLDLHGFSLSLLPLLPEYAAPLRDPRAPAAWPGLRPLVPVSLRPLPDGLTPIQPLPSLHPQRKHLLERCASILIAQETHLNALDAHCGDGDTGSNLAGASRALLASLDHLPLADLTQLLRAIGQEASQNIEGTSGVLLAIFFAAAGDASAHGHTGIRALQAGLQRLGEVSGARIGDRSLMDALVPALAALPQGWEAAARAARAGAEGTAHMARAQVGRSSHMATERLFGWNDPGAEAIACLLEGLARMEGS